MQKPGLAGPDSVGSIKESLTIPALFISAYNMRMMLADWTPFADPNVLWLNTLLLAPSSAAFRWTRTVAERGDSAMTSLGPVVAGLFACAFLCGQLVGWDQLKVSGEFPAHDAAKAFFCLLTGLHTLHVPGGLTVWGKTTAGMWIGEFEMEDVRLSVQLILIAISPVEQSHGGDPVRLVVSCDHGLARGLHVPAGVIYLTVVALRVWNGFYDRKGTYETVEITALYWHFSRPGLPALDAHHHFHVPESRIHRRHIHAHGMGTARAETGDSGAATLPAGTDWTHGG